MEKLDVLDCSNIFIASYFTDDRGCAHCNREHTLIYIYSPVKGKKDSLYICSWAVDCIPLHPKKKIMFPLFLWSGAFLLFVCQESKARWGAKKRKVGQRVPCHLR